MFSRWSRTWAPRLFSPLSQLLARLGVTPNALTAAGLFLAVVAGLCIALDRLLLSAAALALSGLFDALDGELARRCGQNSRLGPFIDSLADHYGDFALYLGLAWRALAGHDPAGHDLAANDQLAVLLVFAAMFGSLVGSHARSRAGMIGIDLKNVGFFTRMERTLVLLLGLLTGWVTPALFVLAIGNNVSALHRVVETIKAGRGT